MKIPKRLEGTDLGKMVLWKAPIKDGEKDSPLYPGLIYRIYFGGGDEDFGFCGLYVFSDTGIQRMAKVGYGEEPEQWRYPHAADTW